MKYKLIASALPAFWVLMAVLSVGKPTVYVVVLIAAFVAPIAAVAFIAGRHSRE